ncbi:MAG: hypothetical protein ACLPVF_12170 [Acidimicrobiales bacterium]
MVERASQFLEKRLSRRNFINRSAYIGSAVAVGSGLDLVLKPGTAYGQICNCAGYDCDCDSTCCLGYSEFCCTINGGYNYCPSGTIMGGWWMADNSSYCNGPRYYMDCNAQCACGCPSSSGFCDPSCDGQNCGCALGSCDQFVTGCFQFRYGQCNQDVDCIGRIVCRVVACVPPWTVDPTCSTTVAVDDGTAEQDAACWTSAPPSPPPPPPPPIPEGIGNDMIQLQVINGQPFIVYIAANGDVIQLSPTPSGKWDNYNLTELSPGAPQAATT